MSRPEPIPSALPPSTQLQVIRPERKRTTYIGGSDSAGVLGKSRWDSPLKVWAEKTGLIPETDIADKMYVRVGKLLEDDVCELFTEETAKKLYRVNETLFHPKYDFIGANLDRRVVGEDAIFEAKTCSAWKAKEWQGEEMPFEYILQCLHYLLVTGKQKCYLAVLIGNSDFKWKLIERNESVLKTMLDRYVSFWNDFILTGKMPIEVTKNDGATLDQLFPQAQNDKEIILGDDANQLVEALKAYEADERNLKGMIEQTKNELKLLLGDAERGVTTLNRVEWLNAKRTQLDTKLLKQDLPDVYAKYCKSTSQRRFVYGNIKQAVE